jgi:anti-sigma28 factor (negative regulator of flagellin synthesis)
MPSGRAQGDHPEDRTSVEAEGNTVGFGYQPVDLLVDTASTERVYELKREIAMKRYDVDAAAVADAIVSKMRLVREGRRALAATEPGADRSHASVGSLNRAQ